MKKQYLLIFLIVLTVSGLSIFAFKKYHSKKTYARYLPIMGPKELYNTDTVYHSVSDFSFINQLGDTITQKNVKGKDFVTEYFFTSCRSICPIMNTNLMRVAKAFAGDEDFKILSHTVKPEEDSVSVLWQYAKTHNANAGQWYFLTGNKKELYQMARYSYLVNNEPGNGDEDDFIHTQLFVLVDKQRRIRGFYDGTNEGETDKLISDIILLKKEEVLNLLQKK